MPWRERACAGTLRGIVTGGRSASDYRAGSVDERKPFDTTVRACHRSDTKSGFSAGVGTARELRGIVIEMQYGDAGRRGFAAGHTGGNCAGNLAMPETLGAGGGAGNCFSIGRPERDGGDTESKCAQSACECAVATRLFVRARAAELGARSLGKKARSRSSAGFAAPGAMQQRRAGRQIFGGDGESGDGRLRRNLKFQNATHRIEVMSVLYNEEDTTRKRA